MSTAKFDNWLNPDGTENYKCRAWVNFNGTGTVAIRASGNVSSITDNGTGNYTVNFTTAMPDENYCVSVSSARGTDLYGYSGIRDVTRSASFIDIGTSGTNTLAGGAFSDGPIDHAAVDVAIFR